MYDTENVRKFNQAIETLPDCIKAILNKIDENYKKYIHEVRFRTNKPMCLTINGKNLCVDINGVICRQSENAFIVDFALMKDIGLSLCKNSIYSYQDDINNGYLTLSGGHRVGVCGSAVFIKSEISVTNIHSVNLRIARQFRGCGKDIMKTFEENGLQSIIIASPPLGGKTTIIRDIARQLSDINGNFAKRVAIIDERCEIAGVSQGVSGNDVGTMSDVLSGYKKSEGIMLAIKTLSPQVIICDEISGADELKAIEYAFHCGVPIIATIHASDIEDLLGRDGFMNMLKQAKISRIIFLHGESRICSIKEEYLYDDGIWHKSFGRNMCNSSVTLDRQKL